MTRHSDSDLRRMAREAELWWRVRALNRHVLGEPDPRDPLRLRFGLCLGLTLGLAALLIVRIALHLDVPMAQASDPDGGSMPGPAILLKVFATATLALCLRSRFYLLVGANMALVAAYLVLTMAVFAQGGPEPVPTPTEAMEMKP